MTVSDRQDIISAATLEALLQPLARATGMPNAVYRDPVLFEVERDVVLGTTWAALAFSSELPSKGYAKPVDFMGLPLAVMRNGDGEFRVFHNVCSHRGMPLIENETEVPGSLRCPYHSWRYDLNGNLKGTPHIGGVGIHQVDGFDCKNHGLKAVRSALWMGIIFVNLSDDAEDFDDFIAPLTRRWQAFVGDEGLAGLRVPANGSTMELEVAANWKLPVENYCESYHLPWVHPALNTYSPLDQHYNIMIGECMSGQGSYAYTLSEATGKLLPQFEHWPGSKIRQAEYLSLYPNVLLGIQADHVFAVILQPLANDRTVEKLQLYYVGDYAIGGSYADCRAAVLESWRVVFTEDVFAVEGMQRGRKSPAFKGGVLTPVMDAATHHFHRWVAKRYAAASGQGSPAGQLHGNGLLDTGCKLPLR
jgi:phenylpropionate dioxygenase-like ring-hydroxylating dioxygenase large terminal subunit